MLKTDKVFISSTFKDMNAERDVLLKSVFPRLREKAQAMGLFIREVDLRWGVTEEQAKRGEALDICLDGIEEGRPYFLCMLGQRYGWIPAPSLLRVGDFERIVADGGALTPDDIALLSSSYHKTRDEKRVYTLDWTLPNETKDRLQAILAKAGRPEVHPQPGRAPQVPAKRKGAERGGRDSASRALRQDRRRGSLPPGDGP